MYLILDTNEANTRNRMEAKKRGCNWINAKYWQEIPLENGKTALNVGKGKGLSKDELNSCVDTLTDFGFDI